MKKIIAMLLVLVMAVSLLAGCNSQPTADPTTPVENKPQLTGTPEELLNKLVEAVPVEFMGGAMAIDLTDTSEDGIYWFTSHTGLENADSVSEAAFYEPMMGSIPYSMVIVRVKEGADAKAVGEAMKSGIDPRKWICVEADDLQVCGYGDVVMLIMVGSDTGMTSQSYVDAFAALCGGKTDFTI